MKDPVIGPTSNSRRMRRIGHGSISACFGLALLALAACGVGCSREPKANANPTRSITKPPNFIVYVADTLRADALACYGNKVISTPTIDGLAAKGVLFERAIAPSSWTRASMASILTGLYPSAHRADGRKSILPDVPRVSQYLKERGYQTANFTTNPNTSAVFGFKAGFDHFEEYGERRRANRVRVTELTVPSDQLHDSITTWIEGLDPEKPFFVYALSIDPHAPYSPPEGFDRYGDPNYDGEISSTADEKVLNQPKLTAADKARVLSLYYGDISYNDHTLGQLLDKLAALGHADDTVVVFTADHGEEFWEHGQRGHGKTLFTESVHVPLIWFDPQNPQAGQRVTRPVSLVDIVPTMLERAQISRPECLQGVSLFSDIRGDRPIFSELNLDSHLITAAYQHPYRFIKNLEKEREYLFDLDSDPVERKNLYKARTDLGQQIAAILGKHDRESPTYCKSSGDTRLDVDEADVPEAMQKNLQAIGYAGWDEDEEESEGSGDVSPDIHDHADEDEDAAVVADDGVEDVPASQNDGATVLQDRDHG